MILKQLRHPNIVEYEDAFQNNGYFYIVTEYCRGGDLRNVF
jgi:NIMA (never in mitosis gene a)-related kinase